MANIMYTPEKERLMEGNANYLTDDLRILLVTTSSTAGTDEDATTITNIGTLNEFTGSGYTNHAGGGNPLTSETVVQVTATDRSKFDAADEALGALSTGGSNIIGAVLYRHKDGTTTNDELVGYFDTGGFNFAANGSSVTIQWSGDGVIELT